MVDGLMANTGVYRDRHVCEPAIAAYVQHGLGINVEFHGRRTLSFDLLNGGCGMLNGLQVLTALMETGEAPVGMVVSSEANADRRPDPSWTYAASGAAVLLDLSPRAGVGFGAFAFDTREEDAELYTGVVSLAVKRGRLLLRRRQAELEEAWLRGAKAVVDEVLERDGLRREDVARVVPAQVSPGFLARLGPAIGFAREAVVDLTAELPDTLTTSTFLALSRSLERAPLAPGQVALLLSFGSGVTVGATTYRF